MPPRDSLRGLCRAPGRDRPAHRSACAGGRDPTQENEMIDHRKLGRELELFHSDPLAGAGLPIWLPAGAAARHAVEEYIREEERRAGYQHVYSPPVAKRQLYELSGHLPHFAEDMFPLMRLSADDEFVLRPALC